MRRFLPLVVLLFAVTPLVSLAATQNSKRQFTVDAHKYQFEPARIEVMQGDAIEITFVPSDIPHSFTIDAYKIAKRAEPGKPATFEFLCDKPGTFRFYCNLAIDEGCKKMAGELVVKPR
jgi:cytochrome c oxidase subunit 2